MNEDDARKDTVYVAATLIGITEAGGVEVMVCGQRQIFAKNAVVTKEALLAATPLGESPTLTVEQIHKLIDENTTPFGGWLCSPNKLADAVAALRESQPPRVLQRTTIAHLTEQLICTHDETQYRALLDENLKLRDRERKVIENAMRWGTNVNPVWFDHPHYGAERLSTEIDNFLNALAALPREREEKS